MKVGILLVTATTAFAAPFTVLVVGDWGGDSKAPYTTPEQLSVAAAMGKIGATLSPQQVWGVGDNFYSDGITCSGDKSHGCKADATSHRFVDTFENVYSASALQVPWWFNAGNHDWHAVANTTAELAYAVAKNRKTNRWNFPYYYYNKIDTFHDASGAAVTVETVMIDTVILCGLTAPHAKGEAGGQPIPHNDTTPIPPASTHLAWLQKTLAASTADVLIVAGHYPVWSIAEHGSTDCLVKEVQPLLIKYKAALYVSGHDHNLQWTDDSTGVGYFHSGAGHDYDSSNAHASTVPKGANKFFAAPSTGGFASLVMASKSSMDLTYYDGTGKVLYEVKAWPNPRA